MLLAAGVLLACAEPARAQAPAACGTATNPCGVERGRYYVAEPDAGAVVGAVIFLHGYQGSGEDVVANAGLAQAVTGAGYLLIAPHGRDGTWNHVGSPAGHDRDELAFLAEVRRDAVARFDLAGKPILVAGFSQGASMVWDVACYDADAYTAFAAVAGAFWQPLPDACPAGAIDLTHIHGLDDEVVPLEGRPIGGDWRQGDTVRALGLMKRHNGCLAAPDRRAQSGSLSCSHWTSCRQGRLRVCLHDGGHAIQPAWIAGALSWMRNRGG
jgi:polyhydroxybutyrate depolymerase